MSHQLFSKSGKIFAAADSDEDGFKYFISVCSSLKEVDEEIECGTSEAAVCQAKKSSDLVADRHSTGESETYNLRYAAFSIFLHTRNILQSDHLMLKT